MSSKGCRMNRIGCRMRWMGYWTSRICGRMNRKGCRTISIGSRTSRTG